MAMFAGGFSPIYPVPCAGGRDAHPSDRHRAVQVRRVQAERVDPAGAQSGLLEAGPAVSGCDRIHHHSEPLDDAAGDGDGQIRPDLHQRPDAGTDQKPAGAGAGDAMRAAADRHPGQSAGQPRASAVRQRTDPPGDGAVDRPQGVLRHPQPRHVRGRRREPAAARRALGLVEGIHGDRAGLWRRCGEKPGGRPPHHEVAGLRPGQDAAAEGHHAEHSGLPRRGGDPDRPPEVGLHPGRAGTAGFVRLVRPPGAQGFFRRR